MNEEDEAFNEIERRSIAKKEAVRAAIDMKEELTKLLIESYDDGVRDALESTVKVIREHDFKKPWVGLTEEEVELYWDWEDFQTGAGRSTIFEMVRDIEAKLKEKNT